MRRLLSGLTLAALALLALGMPGCSSGKEAEGVAGSTDAEVSGASEVTVPATAEHVRLIGRTCESDGVTWLPQSGSAVEFRAVGTHVKVEVVGDDNVSADPSHRPRFAVLVDDKVVVDDVLDGPSRTAEVATGEHASSAVVEVIHLSEAQYGAVGVRSIMVESDDACPVAPTDARDLSIEFIGDSITCGYAVETASVNDPFSTSTENFMASYAYLAAKTLNADYSAVCYSGYGIVSGWSGDGSKNTDMLLPPLYGIVASGYDQPWDFSTHHYDVVVIGLGTNDFTYTGTDKNRLQEFAVGYEAFLAQVRERNPESYIVCTLGTMGCQDLYPSIERAVASFRSRTGDERVTCYLSEPIDMERDGAGTNGHPNRISQQKCADKLVDVIRELPVELTL